jgi:hypothetical protein
LRNAEFGFFLYFKGRAAALPWCTKTFALFITGKWPRTRARLSLL